MNVFLLTNLTLLSSISDRGHQESLRGSNNKSRSYLCISHLLMYECSSVQNTQRFARENKSPSFTPVPLKHIRDVFRLFCISSGRIIVILCFPQALKNDFMLIVA